jgi:glycosyltransferase involved in cell wall biosynthesis
MSGRLRNLETSIQRASDLTNSIKFILIHDGEDLKTERELDVLARKSGSILLTVNVGSPGLARNLGLQFCTSQWVIFWDSDDLGNPENVYDAVSKANHRTQVVVGAYNEVDLKRNSKERVKKPSRNLRVLMMNPGIWRFAFRRELISNVRFPKFSMGEDQVFLANLKLKASEIEFSDTTFYNYFTNFEGQLTSNQNKIMEVRESILEIEKISRSEANIPRYIFILRSKLILTAYKKGVYSLAEFLQNFVLAPRGPLRFRFNNLQGSFEVFWHTLKKIGNLH